MNSLVIFSAFLAVGMAAPDAAVVGGHTSVSQPLSAPHLIHNPPVAHHAVVAAPHHGLGYAGHLGVGHLGYAGHGLGLLGYGHLGGHVIAKRDAAVVGGHTSVSQPLSAPHLIHNPPVAHHAVVAAPAAFGYAGYHGLGHLGYAGHGLGLLGNGHLGGHLIAKRDAAVVGGHTSVSQPLSAAHLIHNPPLAHHAVVAAPHHGLGYAGHLGVGHLGYAGHGLGLLGYGHLGGHVIAKRDAAVIDGYTTVSQPLSAPHLIHNPPLAHHVAAPHHGLGYAGHLGLGYAGHLGLGYGYGR